MMKKIINITFIMLSMVILVLPTFANINIDKTVADIKGRAGDIVYDYADILNVETETQVREIINNIRYDANKGFEMIVVTTKESSGDLEGEANKIFNGVGIGRNDRGLLLYIVLKNDNVSKDRVRLEVGRGLEGDLNDAKAGRILDNYFVPYRSNGDYDNAVKETVDVLYRDIIKGEQINNVAGGEKINIPKNIMLAVLITVGIVIGIFAILIAVYFKVYSGVVGWLLSIVSSIITIINNNGELFVLSCCIYGITFLVMMIGAFGDSEGGGGYSGSSFGSSWGSSDSDSGGFGGSFGGSFGGGFSSGGGASR